MYWFGPRPWPHENYRAPVCSDDNLRIPIPIGEPCIWCDELIDENSRGEDISTMDRGEGGALVHRQAFMHVECAFRQVMGGPAHIQGTCTCQGGADDPDLGMSAREAALLVWESTVDARGYFRYDDPPPEGYVTQ